MSASDPLSGCDAGVILNDCSVSMDAMRWRPSTPLDDEIIDLAARSMATEGSAR